MGHIYITLAWFNTNPVLPQGKYEISYFQTQKFLRFPEISLVNFQISW